MESTLQDMRTLLPRGAAITASDCTALFGANFAERAAEAYIAANAAERARILCNKTICAALLTHEYGEARNDLREAMQLATDAGDATLVFDALRIQLVVFRLESECAANQSWQTAFSGPDRIDCDVRGTTADALVQHAEQEDWEHLSIDTHEAIVVLRANMAHLQMRYYLGLLDVYARFVHEAERQSEIAEMCATVGEWSSELARLREQLTPGAPSIVYVESCERVVRMVHAALREITSHE